LDTTVRVMLVRVSVAVTVAPGTPPPVSSLTLPTSVPTATCATAWIGANKIPSTASVETTRTWNRVPVIALLLVGLIWQRPRTERIPHYALRRFVAAANGIRCSVLAR
jgi:hypothetical protein